MNKIKFTFVHIIAIVITGISFSSCAPIGFTKLSKMDYKHNSSNLVFPSEIGNFKRVSIRNYDQIGEDVSVGYNIRIQNCNVTFTFYVYPKNNITIQNELDNIKKAINHNYKDATKTVEGKCYYSQDSISVEGLRVSYKLRHQMTNSNNEIIEYSHAYLFESKDRFIKYRITYPEYSIDCADKEIEEIMKSLKWYK